MDSSRIIPVRSEPGWVRWIFFHINNSWAEEPVIEGSQQEQLLAQFFAAVTRAHATIERIPASGEAVSRVIFRRIAEATSVVMAVPQLLPTDIFTPLIESTAITSNPSDWRVKDAQIGITEAFAGVARTGSVCVSENSSLSGVVSSFTREHICLLDANYIVRRPRDVFTDSRLSNRGVEDDFAFITGPSATADMGELVYGVHGPASLHILVLEPR